jgi:pseudouridine-5'-monophosphatase
MDGLMVDTEPLSYQAWQEVLRPFGYHLDETLHSQMIGRRMEESLPMVMERFQLPVTGEELIRRRREIYKGIRANGVPAMPGLRELNALLTEHHIPWAVATSSSRWYAEEILGYLHLTHPPQAMACGDEVTNGKPAPDVYLLAAKRLGIPPQHCLALEDSSPGCRAATDAGMTVVAIPTGHTKTGDFSFVRYRFDSLFDVCRQLDHLLSRKG